MSPVEYDTAIAVFLKTNIVTRCPTVCAAPTQATVGEGDRAAYRDYVAAREAERRMKLKTRRYDVLSWRPPPI